MNAGNKICEGLRTVLVKLRTLRDSCLGIFRTQRYPPDFTWFEGAAAICQEAIERIKEALHILDKSRK